MKVNSPILPQPQGETLGAPIIPFTGYQGVPRFDTTSDLNSDGVAALVRPLGLRAVTLGSVFLLALVLAGLRVARPGFFVAVGTSPHE